MGDRKREYEKYDELGLASVLQYGLSSVKSSVTFGPVNDVS